MLKRFAIAIDQDQRDVLASTSIIMFIALLAARQCSVTELFMILPLQFAITSLFAQKTPVRYCGRTFTDARSNKSWSTVVTDKFLQAGFVLTFFGGALALAHEHHAKPLSVFLLLCPLLLTRAVLFIKRLPLAALYPYRLLELDARPTSASDDIEG